MRYASTTTVSPEKSCEEIRKTLLKYGVTEFGSVHTVDAGAISFLMKDIRVMIKMPMPTRASFNKKVNGYGRTVQTKPSVGDREHEQAIKSRWRSLCLLVKAKLVGIADGATTFDIEFMPYMVMSNGKTIGEQMTPRIEAARQGGLLLLEAQ